MHSTSTGLQIESASVINYMDSLVNKFFKILPMREGSEPSLSEYLLSLQREMIGFGNLVPEIGSDKIYVSLLSILQYFADNAIDVCTVQDVRGEVFHAISLCGKLKARIVKGGEAE